VTRLKEAWRWLRAHPALLWAIVVLVIITYPKWWDTPPISYLTDDILGLAPDVAVFIGVYVLLALGLNVVVGFAGLLDLGYVAFFAIGAYTVGWLASGFFSGKSIHFGSSAPAGSPGIHLSFWLVLLAAGAAAALAGVIIGWPTLRLRGDYLAIVTLGFGEIIPDVFRNGDSMKVPCGPQLSPPFIDFCLKNVTNGVRGMRPLDAAGFPGLSRINSDLFPKRFSSINVTWWFIVIVVLVLLTIFICSRLQNSKMGRSWIAVREDEVAASAMGVPLMRTKLWAYGIGAVFGGIGGAYYGSFIGSTDPTSFFFNISVIVLCMVIVGGMGNIAGVVLGAAVLQYLNFTGLDKIGERINQVLNAIFGTPIEGDRLDVPKYKFLFFGILLVIMMLLRPEGILPSARRRAELHEEEEGPERDVYDDLYDIRREGA
jgi:branched-chain amino acid transport system permease protein